MAGRGASVIAIELDPAMARLTREAVGRPSRCPGAEHRRTGQQERTESCPGRCGLQKVATAPCPIFKLVANLPYNVATPIVANLLVDPMLCPTLMVVTIQRELADRMIAPRLRRPMVRFRS